MKEAFWGILIIVLGIFGIVCINLFQNVTVDNDKVYYVLKESTEASAHDSIDLSYYRLGGSLRIVEDKFVENLARRFSQSITAGNYTISVQNINELPPLMSVKVRSGVTSMKGEEFNLTNRIDAIIEAKYKLSDVLDFLGITEDEWNEINNKNREALKDGVCGVTFINDDDLECITGDLRFDGLGDNDLKNAVCIGQQKSNVEATAKYSVCECGKWVSKEETLIANPTIVNNGYINEYIYTYHFVKNGEIRNIDEKIVKRVRADVCTTAVEVYVPKDLREKEPSSDNSKYVKCDPVVGIRIPEDKEIVLHPNYIPSNATNREITWTAVNASLLSFSKFSVTQPSTLTGFSKAVIKGKLSGTEEESTTMTATTTLNQSAVCPIKVWDGNVDSVKCENINTKVGYTTTFKGSYEPYNATKTKLKWSVADTSLVKLDEATGKIEALKEGTTTITMTAENGKMATCTLKVDKYVEPSYSGGGGGGGSYGGWIVTDEKGNKTYYSNKNDAVKAAQDKKGTFNVSHYDGSGEYSWADIKTNCNSNSSCRSTGSTKDGKLFEGSSNKDGNSYTINNGDGTFKEEYNGKNTNTSSGGSSGGSSSIGYGYGGSGSAYGCGNCIPGTTIPKPTPATPTPPSKPAKPPSSGSSGSSSGGSNKVCLTKGTKVALADGTYKNIEDITYNDLLLVWNYETGSYTFEYPIWIEKEGKSNEYTKITFEDDTYLNIVGEHALYNVDINEFVTADNLAIGTTIAKIENNNIKYVKIKSIETIYKNISYYHVVSTRFYNIIANNVLTTDDEVILSNLYGFDNKIKWLNRDYNNIPLYTYDEFKDIMPYYMFNGLRVEEAKVLENYISKSDFKTYLKENQLNESMFNSPKTDLLGNRKWMVTTSEDLVNAFNKNKYLYLEGSTYVIPKNSKVKNWYNTSDGKYYKSGDKLIVYNGIHLIASYN